MPFRGFSAFGSWGRRLSEGLRTARANQAATAPVAPTPPALLTPASFAAGFPGLRRRSRGARTLLTSPLGITGEAALMRKTLLGQ